MAENNLRQKVKKLIEKGYSNKEAGKELRISSNSVRAYKAHITIHSEWGVKMNGLEKYVNNNYFILSVKKVEKKLNASEKSQLVKILEKLEGAEKKETRKPKSREYELGELPLSEIREKVIELRKKGIKGEELYEKFPKKLRHTVVSYSSHFTMGTYKNRGLM